jgi:hypothetical protein
MCITITLSSINWLSVIVVTILSFPLGALWHSKLLFGEAWKKDVAFDTTRKVNILKLFGLSALLHFVAVAGLDLVIGSNSCMMHGLTIGLVISVFWVSTGIAVSYLFAGRTIRLILIDAGYYIVFLSLAGLILGAW